MPLPLGDLDPKTGVSTDIGSMTRTFILGKERHPGFRATGSRLL
jgi:hypothetical protein